MNARRYCHLIPIFLEAVRGRDRAMRILVLRTTRAAPDGVTVTTYEGGTEAELPEELAKVFIAEGWGRLPDSKDLGAAPANKALPGAPRSKRRRRRGRRTHTKDPGF